LIANIAKTFESLFKETLTCPLMVEVLAIIACKKVSKLKEPS
jgi:hypothetical protein